MPEDRFAVLDVESYTDKLSLKMDDLGKKIIGLIEKREFDNGEAREDSVIVRKGDDLAYVTADGTIRVIARRESVEETWKLYHRMVELALEGMQIDLEKLLLKVQLDAILHVQGKKNAKEALLNFLGPDKMERVSQAVGNSLAAGWNVLAADFGKDGSKERVEYDVAPLMSKEGIYYLRIRWAHQGLTGKEFLTLASAIPPAWSRIHEFAGKAKSLVDIIEETPSKIVTK